MQPSNDGARASRSLRDRRGSMIYLSLPGSTAAPWCAIVGLISCGALILPVFAPRGRCAVTGEVSSSSRLTPLFTGVCGRGILGTSPRAQALEGKHPVCFRCEPGHVRGYRPRAVERSQALLVLGGPTGHSAPLSDVDGNLVLFELAQQFSGGRYANALQALDVLFDHQLGSIPGEDHPDLLPDIEGAVGRYVQRHGGQGRVFHPFGDYVEQPHLVLLSEFFRSSGANLSTTSMMPPSEVWCTGRRSIHRSAWKVTSQKFARGHTVMRMRKGLPSPVLSCRSAHPYVAPDAYISP